MERSNTVSATPRPRFPKPQVACSNQAGVTEKSARRSTKPQAPCPAERANRRRARRAAYAYLRAAGIPEPLIRWGMRGGA